MADVDLLPDDWQKTLVGKDGALLYDYPGKFGSFGTRITASVVGGTEWVGQELASPRIPIVRTWQRRGPVQLMEEAFAVTPPASEPPAGNNTKAALARVSGRPEETGGNPPRHDMLLLRLRNTGGSNVTVIPTLTIESESALTTERDGNHVRIGSATRISCAEKFQAYPQSSQKLVLTFAERVLAPGSDRKLVLGVARGTGALDLPRNVAQAERLRKRAERFWRGLDLPYHRLQIPDPGVQALLDSAVRNIYQAREIKKGLPAFQVGPTCYRGLWVVDGSFLLEAMTYLGRATETRSGIKYLLSFQRDDGGIMLIDGHWKETGIALWAVARHARLTGDKAWLADIWPKVERAFAYIHRMRQMASQNKDAPNFELIPDGFSDGGLADKVPEYTNIYWTLAGMRAAVEAARWLGHTTEAEDWQRQYEEFYRAFRRAAERDLRTDPYGNRYLPIRMAKGEDIPPQKAQWAFLHSVFPGQIYSPGDPLVRGNMAMLRSVEKEGLVFDTGWLKNGIWNYFGSFYAHAWLWLGDGDKAARTLYAFGNHASPLLVWREEQKPAGQGDQFVGDMPHNWASAEFIRLVRHSLLLDRGNELHLFEAFPAAWAKPGAVTRARDILTDFGPVSLELRVAADGTYADLNLQPPTRNPPARILLHLDHWSGQAGTLELEGRDRIRRRISLR